MSSRSLSRVLLAAGLLLALVAAGSVIHAQDPVTPPPRSIDALPGPFSPPPPPPAWYAAFVAQANDWLTAYGRLLPAVQRQLAPVARLVVEARRVLMLALVTRDPERALQVTLMPGRRAGLPPSITDRLERLVDGIGDSELSVACSAEPPVQGQNAPKVEPDRVGRQVVVKGRRYEAHVYGRRTAQRSKYGLPVHGIALDGHLAWRADPLRLLDPFEKVQLGYDPKAIVAIGGDMLTVFGNLVELEQRIRELMLRELGLGPYVDAQFPEWTTGVKSILIIRVDFSDIVGPPVRVSDGRVVDADLVNEEVADANMFLQANSQGQLSITATLHPDVLRMPEPAAAYAPLEGLTMNSAVRLAALEVARARGHESGRELYHPDRYDRYMIVFSQIRDGASADGEIGGWGMSMHGVFFRASIAHEFGHTLGFLHASYLYPLLVEHAVDADPLVPGYLDGTGDNWDRMARGPYPAGQFNAFYKAKALWLVPDRDWTDAAASGTWRIYAHDIPGATGLRALRIDVSAERAYWLDVRRGMPEDVNLSNGLEVRYEDKGRWASGDFILDYEGVVLLDMNAVTYEFTDHALVTGQTFRDPANGIEVRVLGIGSDAMGSYVDVEVVRTL